MRLRYHIRRCRVYAICGCKNKQQAVRSDFARWQNWTTESIGCEKDGHLVKFPDVISPWRLTAGTCPHGCLVPIIFLPFHGWFVGSMLIFQGVCELFFFNFISLCIVFCLMSCLYYWHDLFTIFHQYHFWVVVSNISYFHPYLGKWSNLTNIFQMGWKHQLDIIWFAIMSYYVHNHAAMVVSWHFTSSGELSGRLRLSTWKEA